MIMTVGPVWFLMIWNTSTSPSATTNTMAAVGGREGGREERGDS